MDIGCMGLNRRSLRPNRRGFQLHSIIIVKHLILHPLTDFHRLRTIITGFTRLAKFAPVLKVPNSEVFEPYLENEVEFRKSKKNAPRCRPKERLAKISFQSACCNSFTKVGWKKKTKKPRKQLGHYSGKPSVSHKKIHGNRASTIVGNPSGFPQKN